MATATVTTSSTQVISAKRRAALVVQNNSDTDIWINVDGPVSIAEGPDQGIRLKAAGGSMSFTNLPEGQSAGNVAIYAIHAGVGNKPLTYISI